MADQQVTAIQEAVEREGLTGLLVARWFGAWIDFIVLAGIVLGPSLLLEQTTYALALPFLAGAAVLYFPLTEGLWGRSVGKLITGLRVVDKNGRTPNIWRVLVRTVMRLIEVNPFLVGGVPAGLCAFFTKYKQRLGDLAAGTYVLSASTIRSIVETEATLAEVRARSG